MSGEIPWEKRYSAIRKIQKRYLFLLLVFGLFFLAIEIQSNIIGSTSSGLHLKIPVIGLEIEATLVRIMGPVVIFLLLLSILGSIDAANRALDAINIQDELAKEAYDDQPNLINLALDWGSTQSRLVPNWLRWSPWVKFLKSITVLSLPIWLSLFYIEAIYLLFRIGKVKFVEGADKFLIIIGIILSIASLYRMAELYILRIIEIKNIILKKTKVK